MSDVFDKNCWTPRNKDGSPIFGQQVRAVEATHSIDDALSAEIKVVGAGGGPETQSAPTPIGYLDMDGSSTPIYAADVTVDQLAGGGADYVIADGPIESLERFTVSGTLTVTYKNPVLYRAFFYDEPVWLARLHVWAGIVKRELLWIAHNVIAHPITEITHWLGFVVPPLRRFGLWLHDITIPAHDPEKGRG